MARSPFMTPRRVNWRALGPSLGASVMLLAAAFSPAALAAGAPADVARKDTLVISEFGPGNTELQDRLFLPYQSTIYQAIHQELNGQLFDHRQARPFALMYGV